MKMMRIKIGCTTAVLLLLVSVQLHAQNNKAKKKPAAKPQSTTVDPFGNPINNAPANNTNKAKTNTTADPFGGGAPSSSGSNANKSSAAKDNKTIPLEVVPTKGGSNPLTDSVKQSLRNDNGNDQNLIRDRFPLEYDFIREDDAFFKERIWSIIDTREKINLVFRNPRSEDNGSQLFFAILFKAVIDGNVTAFEDERFTTPISKDRFLKEYAGGYDTVPVYGDLDNPDKITKYEVRTVEFPVDSVYQFQIKEDIIFDKESSRLVRRILGIAPMVPFLNKGKVVQGVSNEAFPKFWIYYPDIRPVLAKYKVYNPKNYGAGESWEDLLESHKFGSYIVKTTYNNYKDLRFKDYINDPLFRLLEGEKVKEKIFNFEQNLWSY